MKTIILNFMFVFSFVSFVQAQQIKPIVSTQVNATLQKEKKAIVLDVRTPGEFSQGHIAKATNLDVNNPNAFNNYKSLDKTKAYIIICRTKNRSGVVANYMIQNGFTNIYQVTDGMVGWMQNNLPIQK